MDINEILTSTGKHDKDIVDIVKPVYPGVNRPLVVMVRNTERYGICFVDHAVKMIEGAFAVKPYKPRSGDRHRLSHRISFRVSQEKLEGVNTAIRARGYDTMQSGMSALIDAFLENPDMLPER